LFDRFGNTYDRNNDLAEATNSVSCISGYFELITVGVPADLEPTICQVFSDISEWITQRENETSCEDPALASLVRIEVSATATGSTLAAASPLYDYTYSPCYQMNLSRPYRKINGGLSNSLDFDGVLNINPSPEYPWHLDWTTPCEVEHFDLYSAVLHEAMHILGYASLVGTDGNPIPIIFNFEFFSLWDQYIHTAESYDPNGQSVGINQLLVSDCLSNCWELDNTLFPNDLDLENAVTYNCTTDGNVDFVFGNNAIAPLTGGREKPQVMTLILQIC